MKKYNKKNYYTSNDIKKKVMKSLNISESEFIDLVNSEIESTYTELKENIHMYDLFTSLLEDLTKENRNGSNEY